VASLKLRRFRPEHAVGGVDAIAARFPFAHKEGYGEEVADGILEFLGENWHEVHATLVGSADEVSSAPSQVVMGGSMLGPTSDETALIVALRPDEVAAVAAYLAGLDQVEIRRLMELHTGEIEQILGEIDDWESILAFLIRTLDDLRVFYTSAVQAGDAVFKLFYD
jgi:hypothetical protein